MGFYVIIIGTIGINQLKQFTLKLENMEKCLVILTFIAVLTSSISATTDPPHCNQDSDGEYEICKDADIITSITRISNSTDILELDVNNFSAIDAGAFQKMKIRSLVFYSPQPNNCNPKFLDLIPQSFEGLSTSNLTLQCMKFKVEPNPFINLTSISILKLERVELMGNMSKFFANFLHLDQLILSDLNITTISPDIFSGINEDLNKLYMEDGINVVEPKSFERFHNLKTLELVWSQLVKLRSDMFYGLTQLRRLDLSDNKITVLRRDTFNEVPRIQVLLLNYNKIRRIESETFSGLNLTTLELFGNNLKNLPVGVFQNLENLKILDLGFNKIRTVPYNVFEGCISLDILFLNHNKIYYIEPAAFWGLNLHQLYLNHNQLTVLQHDAFIGLRVQNLLNLNSNDISKIEPEAFRNLTAGRVSLCWHNMTQVDRDGWGVDKSINITIKGC